MKKSPSTSSEVTRGVVDFLKEKGESGLLPQVAQALEHLADRGKKPHTILVRSAAPLSTQQKDALRRSLRRFGSGTIPMSVNIDPNLLGGFIVQIDDWVLDVSLAHELFLLKQYLLNA